MQSKFSAQYLTTVKRLLQNVFLVFEMPSECAKGLKSLWPEYCYDYGKLRKQQFTKHEFLFRIFMRVDVDLQRSYNNT